MQLHWQAGRQCAAQLSDQRLGLWKSFLSIMKPHAERRKSEIFQFHYEMMVLLESFPNPRAVFLPQLLPVGLICPLALRTVLQSAVNTFNIKSLCKTVNGTGSQAAQQPVYIGQLQEQLAGRDSGSRAAVS